MGWLEASLSVFLLVLVFGICGGIEQSATINDDICILCAAVLCAVVFLWVRRRSRR